MGGGGFWNKWYVRLLLDQYLKLGDPGSLSPQAGQELRQLLLCRGFHPNDGADPPDCIQTSAGSSGEELWGRSSPNRACGSAPTEPLKTDLLLSETKDRRSRETWFPSVALAREDLLFSKSF